MDATTFGEIMLWVEGAYARQFPEATRRSAWTLLHRFPEVVVKQAAVRMVELHERFPSPALWFQIARTLQEEAVERTRMETVPLAALPPPRESVLRSVAGPRGEGETDEDRIAYLRAFIDNELAGRDDCREFIRLVLARPYPPGHVLSGMKAP